MPGESSSTLSGPISESRRLSAGEYREAVRSCTKSERSVVTRLWLKSDCDRDLVAMAAAKLVEERKGEILKFLQQ